MGTVSRGGLKLEAAIRHFALEGRIAGARAVDVGASTGGFTEALLGHGAAHVTAVDVGHGQLHPSLRSDPRVESLEGADWKTLPLATAPGPFDFFSVDVSFMAARNVLRGLAFRLRPGAEGVVLIKPQFELAGGDVDNPELRKRAVEKVRKKGESLGFEILGVIDSPVAGGEGTVEMLAHLRFRGRSAKLPQPGERRGSPQKAPRAVPDQLALFAVAAPGLEPVLEREVRAFAPEARAVAGGVEFAGTLETLYRANLWLRTATRVLLRVGTLEARDFSRLRRGVAKLPWPRFVAEGAALDFHVSQTRSRLYHTGAVEENLALAIRDAVGAAGEGPAVGIYARGERDQWTLSVDSSGELLHRRGWRRDVTEAPLRETLAAGMLLLCEWDPETPLVDPMCGSGTIALEACAMAMRMPPGLAREFAFMRWPDADTALWSRLREQARAELRPPPAPILASDRDAKAVRATIENAQRGGFDVTIAQKEFALVAPPPGRGLVLVNPPYGRRLGDPRALRRLCTDLGRWLRSRFAGWRAGVLLPGRDIEKYFGLPLRAAHDLRNGGLRVRLLQFDVPQGQVRADSELVDRKRSK